MKNLEAIPDQYKFLKKKSVKFILKGVLLYFLRKKKALKKSESALFRSMFLNALNLLHSFLVPISKGAWEGHCIRWRGVWDSTTCWWRNYTEIRVVSLIGFTFPAQVTTNQSRCIVIFTIQDSLRADVSYFLCFTRKWEAKEIGDVCTQATFRTTFTWFIF